MRPYEGMWVVHNKESRKDLDYLENHIQELVGKAGGRVVALRKWDDRRLAYEINHQSHGIYYLTYFEGETDTVTKLRHEVRLSELVLRALFLSIESFPDFRAAEEPEEGEDAASKDAASKDAVSKDAVSKDAVSKDAVSKDAAAEAKPETRADGKTEGESEPTSEAAGASGEAAAVASGAESTDSGGEADTSAKPEVS